MGAPGESSAATGVDGDQSSNAASQSGAVYVFTRSGVAWTQQAYLKASNTGAHDEFGLDLSLSADGSTLAVGSFKESSAATGVNGDQKSNAASESGAVYVFTRSAPGWSQQAYVKASNTDAGDIFGSSVSLSVHGDTLAVGAAGESSAATGVNGDQSSNAAYHSGAAYVFTRSGTAWTQQAYIKASNTAAQNQFGTSVSLSADGSMLAAGALVESSAATGVNGDQSSNGKSNGAHDSGAAYVFVRSGISWTQRAYLKASNTDAGDYFGASVSLSADGGALAVGAPLESSAATGVDGDQSSNAASRSGAVYVFTRNGSDWHQQAYLKASNTDAGDWFGSSVSLSADGSTLAVGATQESSAATGVNGDQSNNDASRSGAVYVF